MQSTAKTVAEYIASLPEDRRGAIKAVRDVIRERVPKGYQEGMGYGMITWDVPLLLDVIGDIAAAVPMKKYIAIDQAVHGKKKK